MVAGRRCESGEVATRWGFTNLDGLCRGARLTRRKRLGAARSITHQISHSKSSEAGLSAIRVGTWAKVLVLTAYDSEGLGSTDCTVLS